MTKQIKSSDRKELFKEEFKKYIPTISKLIEGVDNMDMERFRSVAIASVTRTPKLLECTASSLCGAIYNSAVLGLEIGNGLGQAYIVPFAKNGSLEKEAQLITGYKGLIDLAHRSGKVLSISSRCVYEGDYFEYNLGLHEDIKHRHTEKSILENNKITAVYAVAHLKGGGHQIEVLYRAQIDKIRNASQGYRSNKKSGPWTEHYGEMARKTLIRRIFKYIPVNIQISKAVSLDDNFGSQNNSNVINGEFDQVEESPVIEKSATDELINKMTGEVEPITTEENENGI